MHDIIFSQLNNSDIQYIKNGVGVLPTDTVYGLVAPLKKPQLVKRLYSLKSRENKPGTIIASNQQQLIDIGIDKKLINLASKYWPGPVSVIFPVNESLNYVHQGVGSLAIRVTSDLELAGLIDITGPLVTSSANLPGDPISTNIDEAKSYFGDKVDFYVDGGDFSNQTASTIIKIYPDGSVRIIREGSVNISVI